MTASGDSWAGPQSFAIVAIYIYSSIRKEQFTTFDALSAATTLTAVVHRPASPPCVGSMGCGPCLQGDAKMHNSHISCALYRKCLCLTEPAATNRDREFPLGRICFLPRAMSSASVSASTSSSQQVDLHPGQIVPPIVGGIVLVVWLWMFFSFGGVSDAVTVQCVLWSLHV